MMVSGRPFVFEVVTAHAHVQSLNMGALGVESRQGSRVNGKDGLGLLDVDERLGISSIGTGR